MQLVTLPHVLFTCRAASLYMSGLSVFLFWLCALGAGGCGSGTMNMQCEFLCFLFQVMILLFSPCSECALTSSRVSARLPACVCVCVSVCLLSHTLCSTRVTGPSPRRLQHGVPRL